MHHQPVADLLVDALVGATIALRPDARVRPATRAFMPKPGWRVVSRIISPRLGRPDVLCAIVVVAKTTLIPRIVASVRHGIHSKLSTMQSESVQLAFQHLRLMGVIDRRMAALVLLTLQGLDERVE